MRPFWCGARNTGVINQPQKPLLSIPKPRAIMTRCQTLSIELL